MRSGPVVLGALWVATACLATGVGLVAVHLVAGEVGEQVASPLSDDDVQGALAGVTPTAATPTRSASPRPSATSPATPRTTSTATRTAAPQGELRTIRTEGGVVGARCVSGAPRLVYASPAEGWRTERSRNDDVRFVKGEERVEVRLSCTGSVLRAEVDTDGASPTPSPRESTGSPEPSESPDPDHADDGS